MGPDGLDEMFEIISDVCLLEIPKLAHQLTHLDKEELKKLMRHRSLAKEALMKYIFPRKGGGKPVTPEHFINKMSKCDIFTASDFRQYIRNLAT